MPRCEAVVWQADELEMNIDHLYEELKHRGRQKLASDVRRMAARPGALHTCLALSSTHVPRPGGGQVRAQVLGRALSLVSEENPGENAENLVDRLNLLFRWEYGIAAIDLGIDSLDDHVSRVLLSMGGTGLLQALRALWLVGLLKTAKLEEDWEQVVEELCSGFDSGLDLSVLLAGVSGTAGRCLCSLEEALIGPLPSGVSFSPEDDKLWWNALVMAKHHENSEPEYAVVFRELLRHIRRGGRWPLPFLANEDFKDRALGKDNACADFWRADLSFAVEDEDLGQLELKFEDEPLAILNVGNAFDSCLRSGGLDEGKLLGWATNVNLRVIVVKGQEGRLLGRRTIGLSIQDAVGVSPFRSYPLGNPNIHRATEEFVRRFRAEANLEPFGGGDVEDTCAPAYKGDLALA